ncbi:alpha/beta hydrolase family protein [Peribacillus simplex]|uniref:alpha/beta hydrolase family protein n=1 Tax=Peribacillus simplex TaxID=1478 RepID=UPI0024C10E6E|nr:alpha/beta hydrolase [Peribacillus simplex]WHY57527.1 alpha/beta hydrolase [Peribacillus simplex]
MKRLLAIICIIMCAFVLMVGCRTKDAVQVEEESKEVRSLKAIEGRWAGDIKIPNQPLPIIVHFTKKDGTISIPVQGLNEFPLTSVKLSKSDLFFDMDIQNQKITFDGKVDQERISGTFVQNGQAFPFELLKKSDQAVLEKETGEIVQADLKNGTIKGLLVTPKNEGPFPVMIIIAGSGPTDKDGNTIANPGKNNSLKMLAESLAEKGIASIRYDKRGIGDNMQLAGKEKDLRFEQYIDDAAAWAQFAKKDGRFSKVGIIGHSEGSLIGMAAAKKTETDIFISLAGAGEPIDQVLIKQLEEQLTPTLLTESKDILAKLKQGRQVGTVSADLQSVFRPSVQPYLISWIQYNPIETVKELNVPVLIVNGNRDIQVPATNAKALHKEKSDSELLILEKMNHVLKEAPEDRKGNLATYTNPELPLSPGLVNGIIEFLNKNDITSNEDHKNNN